MKNNPIQEFLSNLRISFLGDNLMHKYDNEQAPLRAELFSLEQAEQYARTLARNHILTTGHAAEQLLKRLADNEATLLEVHNLLTESAKENIRIAPAGEWLLDNFYLIEEQIYTGKKHLPRGYSKGLPQLQKGPSAGLPRVYDLAVELICHSDGRVDLKSLCSFVAAYQEVSVLNLGELWAIPIMLRLALIENLRRLAAQIANDRINKNLADYWADQFTQTAEKDPKNLILIIADMARYGPPMVSSFVAELTRRLQGKGSAFSLPLTWIEQQLSEQGLNSTELVHLENQKQAADQVSMSNSIGSLRFLNTNDWKEFVENTSVVEQTLRLDEKDMYAQMDFRTRDHYRHVIERMAKSSVYSENEIAKMAIRLAKDKREEDSTDYRKAHVGYYLVDKGMERLEKLAAVKLSARMIAARFIQKKPLLLYAGSILLLTFFFTGFLVQGAFHSGWKHPGLLMLLIIVVMLAASHLAVSLVNWIATQLVKPNLLSRMDFSKEIPEEFRTLIAVPTIFSNNQELDELIDRLEVHYLANRDENLYFGLLTDFKDAHQQTLPGEEEMLYVANRKIEELNLKYNKTKNEKFFLFHRARKWNAREKIWMGYERKRGKLSELNALLRGRSEGDFSLIVGDPDSYSKIRYIITLDTDTVLPRDAAWKFIGTMAHPLNHALYNPQKQRITEGYGILQPRVAVSLPHGDSSLYARMHGNEPGIDPYTRAVSDVYQDLFGEGSFIGKGIYDIDAFELALGGKLPVNRVLSHDLLEGSYARCALISDVLLYEEYPNRYDTDMKRRHRWIRGDWQIASWLLPRVPGPGKKRVRNPISALSKWKIADNLRRSLVPLDLILLLLYGWMLSNTPGLWTVAVTIIVILPSVIGFFWEIKNKPDDINLMQHGALVFKLTTHHFVQHLFMLATLPYEAFVNLHAILLVNWRLLITKRKLLQWNPSAFALHKGRKNLLTEYFHMWIAPVVAIACFLFLSSGYSISLAVAVPLLLLWVLSPLMAWRISLPYKEYRHSLTDSQKNYLQKISRKTWAFFERFVAPEDNWLPPDNYQETPVERIAHRSSPTNIGLALLANLSAYDFGYIPAGQVIQRVSFTMTTMQRLERYRGHFFNWYDTQSLLPLPPRYVSTVDSGNLAGHLLTLKQGLLGLPADRLVSRQFFSGLRDTAAVLQDKLPDNELLKKFISVITRAYSAFQDSPDWFYNEIKNLLRMARELEDSLQAVTDSLIPEWAEALVNQCMYVQEDLLSFIPWLANPSLSSRLNELGGTLVSIPTLIELSNIDVVLLPGIDKVSKNQIPEADQKLLDQLKKQVIETSRRAKERILICHTLASQCELFADMEFDFLFDKSQRLLSIGYNVEEHRRDNSYYDLLASESRLTTFVGIAQGKLPQDSWFALGRQLTNPGSSPVLLSWSGSMFEYLMPLLVMPTYDQTLLDETNKAMVQKQIEYGKKREVPWGVSESGFNAVDASLNYQYRAFGVPGLGLKRGLGEDLVIAPYATVMALMVAPEYACENLEAITRDGFEGEYGFFEAIDYTPSRLVRGQSLAIVRSFMVHHQGMSLLSLAYLLLNKPMQRRFENEAQFRAILLLLQERIPKATEFYSPSVHVSNSSVASPEVQMRVINTPHTPVPEIQLLSNGRYHVMVSNSGGGYSRWKDIAVTRWREDSTSDNYGIFCYIRDLDNDQTWSSAFQPTLKPAESYEVVFSQGRAEFRRRDQNMETHTEIVVSSEDDVEIRRVHINNKSRKKRYIEITSYAEVVLSSAMADAMHPAFSNLFVETEILNQRQAILCTRRARSSDESPPYMFHLMKVHNAEIRSSSYETDRSKFIGRGNSTQNPIIINNESLLSGTQGSVLDPIVSIQYRFVIEPHESATVDLVIGMAENKETAGGLIKKYQDRPLADRAFELAWTHSQVVLTQINATETDAQLYGRLAGSVIYANASLRADPAVLIKNQRGQSGLWSYSISGDLPIVLLQIQDAANIDLVKQLVQAHAYWRLKGLMVDLVIWNEDHGGYRQILQSEIISLVSPGSISDYRDKPGGIFIRSADQLSNEDKILFQTVARLVITDTLGTLEEQITRRTKVKNSIPYFTPSKFYASLPASIAIPQDLKLFNGTGGFSKEGTEYLIVSSGSRPTPAPWVNVLANPGFGTIVSESGQSYTWMENAHEYRLSPWNNDPVSDLSGEAFYLRDEESGRLWSPTPLPLRGKHPYITRHGFGYSIFEYLEDGIHSEMNVFVDKDAPVKFMVLTLRNNSQRSRHLSVTGYIEWVLGDLRSKSQMHIVTSIDAGSGAILARNVYNAEFGNYISFFDVDEAARTFTTDRTEFLGRNGSIRQPEAMSKAKLSGKWGAAMDPCAAIQIMVEIDDGEERQIIFRLGAGKDMNDAIQNLRRFKGAVAANDSLEKVKKQWTDILGTIRIQTPDDKLNLIANGWLQYQTIACRLFARSGFYQSGGAFGFRDQLQDSLSFMHSRPDLTRSQILLSASRQFPEGDVQHWWHPPAGRGVRTTCSDDYLWLPFVIARYVQHTGDLDILLENIGFLDARLLNPEEESNYDLPSQSEKSDILYNHCVRAIDRSIQFGAHGLPLIGSGDWNDGLDKVGNHGKGESVWLGFFLYSVLTQFKDVAKLKGDHLFADKCIKQAEMLKANLDKNSWDGAWYRRAYFDDGSPLGSGLNDECKIDSIPQSWSVLSGGGDALKARMGMDAAYTKLVRKDLSILQLFDPPFDHSAMNPGYIKGYAPGVRENGGQYTHAAIWLIMAFAALKDKKRCWELLQMINPVQLCATAEGVDRYKVEPYVVAADVYALKGQEGRGGWTWYTGSAGWMYQLIIESVLGIKRHGNSMWIEPCIPEEWTSCSLQYRYLDTVYSITFTQDPQASGNRLWEDDQEQETGHINLVNDRVNHKLKLVIGLRDEQEMPAESYLEANVQSAKP